MQGNGKTGDTDGYSTITRKYQVDMGSRTAVREELEGFQKNYASAEIEHSLVISPTGETFEVSGLSGLVNTELVGIDALEGSTIIHNHPVWEGYDKGDSFSETDIVFAVRNRAGMQYLISGTRRDAFIYHGKGSEAEIREAYSEARRAVYQRALDMDIPVDFLQEEIMRILCRFLEGFEFYENIRF